jgi:hypothetical protein
MLYSLLCLHFTALQCSASSKPAGKPLNYAFSGYATTIFEVMSKLAAEHKSVNLGQVSTAAAAAAAAV